LGGHYNGIAGRARLMIVTRIAVLVAGALMAISGCTGDSGGGETPVASRSTQIEGPTRQAAWADLAVGRRPTIPYVRGHRYIAPHGGHRSLPGRRGVSGVVAFSGGLLVSDATYFEGTNGLALVRRGARVGSWPSSHCSSGIPVASSAGRDVAWVTVRCPESRDRSIGAVHRSGADGSGEVTQPIGAGLAGVVGFLGRRVVYNAGFRSGAWIADFRGDPTRIRGVERVRAVNPRSGWLIGARGDHSRLVVEADGTVRWRAPAGDLIAFSPDGAMVLSVQGRSQISALRSRDGSRAATVNLPAGTQVWSTVWETKGTLLTLRRTDNRVAIVRVYLDGRVERATPPLRLDNGRFPYVLLSAS
jgi:hypothetical protein